MLGLYKKIGPYRRKGPPKKNGPKEDGLALQANGPAPNAGGSAPKKDPPPPTIDATKVPKDTGPYGLHDGIPPEHSELNKYQEVPLVT